MRPRCVRLIALGKSNDPAYNALRQTLSSTVGRHRQVSEDVRANDALADDTIALAVLVTTANLFTAQLNKQSELMIEQVRRLEVLAPGEAVQRPIIVMTEAAFAELMTSLSPRWLDRETMRPRVPRMRTR